MSKLGDDLIASMKEAVKYQKTGELDGGRIHKVIVKDVDIRALRARLRMSQREFAKAFGVGLETLRNWEHGKRRPEGPARTLLTVIDRNPKAVFEALHDAV